MKSILYTMSVLITLYWVMGAFVWDLGYLIHIMPILAAIAFLSGAFYDAKRIRG